MKRLIPVSLILVLVVFGIGLGGCRSPMESINSITASRSAAGAVVWNGAADKAVAVTVEAAVSARTNASGDKIASNAHSADFPGVYFIWDSKQKDNGYLKVNAAIFDEYLSFVLTAKESNKYWDFVIQLQPGQVQTEDGCYVFFIPKSANNKNINMVFIGGFVEIPPFVGKIYFLSPDGSDAEGDGSIQNPWFTFRKAQEAVEPGDTVYLRGGRYNITDTAAERYPVDMVGDNRYAIAAIVINVAGIPGRPISFAAYPEDAERPVIDLQNFVVTERTTSGTIYVKRSVGILMGTDAGPADYVILKGFDITNLRNFSPTAQNVNGYAVMFRNANHSTLDYLRMYHNEGTGVYIRQDNPCSYNLIKNCDAFNNGNVTGSAASINGNTDGFGFHGYAGSVGNVFYGCRAWANCDDGVDCIAAAGQLIVSHCWAAYNGRYYSRTSTYETWTSSFGPWGTETGDNNGFKIGGWGMGSNPPAHWVVNFGTPTEEDRAPMHVLRYSFAFGQNNSNITSNYQIGGGYFHNNTAYAGSGTGVDFKMMERPDAALTLSRHQQVNTRNSSIINNVAVPRSSGTSVQYIDIDSGIVKNNSFAVVDNGATLAGRGMSYWSTPSGTYPAARSADHTKDIVQNAMGLDRNADFLSLQETLFFTARQADGSLPAIDLARPVPGSAAYGIGYTAQDNNEDGFMDLIKLAGAAPSF